VSSGREPRQKVVRGVFADVATLPHQGAAGDEAVCAGRATRLMHGTVYPHVLALRTEATPVTKMR